MKFVDLEIKSTYTSETSSVYYDFFNKILKNSTKYCRFGGLFSGQKFVQCADGLQEFLNDNDGQMELAIIPIFDEKDIHALKTESKMKIISEQWKVEIDKIKDALEEDHVKALAWMIAHDRLKIKLILPHHEDGTPLSEKELLDVDEFRNEVGIFFNKEDGNEPLSFKGNFNFDNEQFPDGYVDLRTSRMWIDSEKEHLDAEFKKFHEFWDADSCEIGNIKCKIEPLKDELLTYFEQTSPSSLEEVKTLKKLPNLFEYQKDARDAWIDNDGIGIFEMGTGTGKTYTGIGCIKKLQEKHKKLLVLVAVPFVNLVDQWQEEMKKWYFDPPARILDGTGWIGKLHDEVTNFNKNSDSISILICTHAKFARRELIDEIKNAKVPMMLIVDEAHHVGSGNAEKDNDGVVSLEGSRKGLSSYYKYRLALSATINRHRDEEGTAVLRDYFTGPKGDTVYEYSLERAIKEKKLCEYYYYPYFVELTSLEFDRYREITIKAVRLLRSKHLEMRIKGEDMLKQRAWIIRDAEEKINKFPEVIKDLITELNEDIRHLLLFCSHNQYVPLEKLLDNPELNFNYKHRIDHVRITYKDPPNTKDRPKRIEQFRNEMWHVLLANKVLDEGMDVPQAKSCIIMASTTNPAQFIQRRGRVLRKFDGTYKDGTKKKYAYIFDLLVRPKIDEIENVSVDKDHSIEDLKEARKYEIKIVRNQLEKIETMSKLAKNKSDLKQKIDDFKYGLPKECFDFEYEN